MAKFSGSVVRPNVHAPIASTNQRIATHEGAPGYARDAKSELFLLAVTNMVREQTFYESGKARDSRFVTLVHLVTEDDPEWVARFVPYLRDTMNMRSASVVMAAEYVKAGGPNGRYVVSSALKRPDEPAELLAYWHAEHGRRLPAAVKRGVADASTRLFNEYAALKYDGVGKAWRLADVIELVHPKPSAQWQSDLFKYLLDKRHDRDEIPESLEIVRGVTQWDGSLPLPKGVTWERLSGTRKMDKEAWEAVIPQMGYMALLRNLRNFDEAGVSDEVATQVSAKLSDPVQVSKSRQFPIRFLSAYLNAPSLRWGYALEQALQHSLTNVPTLPGKTLILVDVSGSMAYNPISQNSKVYPWQMAAVFGSALALKAEHADLYAYSGQAAQFDYTKATSLLRMVPSFMDWPGAGGGTQTYATLQHLYAGHDRVVILTDEQAFGHGHQTFDNIPLIYTFNLAGYRAGHLPSGEKGRYTFGGLTDAGFRAIDLLERAKDANWPF